MFCKNCGDKLGPADRFCGSCGTPKVELCPTCGQIWDKAKDVAEIDVPSNKPVSKAKVLSQEAKPAGVTPAAVAPQPEAVAPKIQIEVAHSPLISSARVQPIYGKLYEAGKDCPNCGEKGQKNKKCSTCKGTF